MNRQRAIKNYAIGGWLLVFSLTGCVSHIGKNVSNQQQAVDNYMSLARGYLQEGYTEKAIKPLKRALEINHRSADAYGMLALTYQVQGEDKLADTFFRKALSYDARAADVQNNYGAFLFSQGRLADAYREFARAAENMDYEKRSRAYENMGIVALKQDKSTLAKQHFKKSLRLNGNLVRAHFELAALLRNEGEYRSAWSHYKAFTRQSRQTPRSLWLGIQLARMNGDRDAAASYAVQLESLYPASREFKAYRSLVRYE